MLDTLTCALWALHESETFKEGLLMAVNLGGDADTVGAVYGQLAGAIYGKEGLPSVWFETLYKSSTITEICKEIETVSYLDKRCGVASPR